MSRKIIIGSSLAGAAFGLTALVALASHSLPSPEIPPPMVQVLHTGKVMVRGAIITDLATSTIVAVSTMNSLAVTWTLKVDPKTEIARREGGQGTFSELAKDHIISFEGTLVAGASPTVEARIVRSWSVVKAQVNQFGVIKSINAAAKSFVLQTGEKERGDLTVTTSDTTKYTKGNATTTFAALTVGAKVTASGLWDRVLHSIHAERVKIHTEDRRVFEGGKLKSIASTTPPTSFVMTWGRFDYTVNVAVDTSILNVRWGRAALLDFKVGDNLRVYGVAEGTVIDATVIRNINLK